MKILNFIKKFFIPIGINIAQISITLAASFFVFQIIQTWLFSDVESGVMRWGIPLVTSLSVALYFISIFFIHNYKRKPYKIPPSEELALSILKYGNQLHIEGRDHALVSLRNNFSLTLHILGFHKIRTELGEIALKSATIINDNSSKSEILIDDLGWANYLLDRKEIAQKNIIRGVELAKTNSLKEKKNLVRYSLCAAKGLRHMAIIDKDSKNDSLNFLDEALNLLGTLPDQSLREIKIDTGQIYHAKALVKAISLNIHKSGKLRPNDDFGEQNVNEALGLVRKSSAIFRDVGDLERYTKALFLEVRLLESVGKDTEAIEVSALRDRTLAASEWVRPEGSQTLTGK